MIINENLNKYLLEELAKATGLTEEHIHNFYRVVYSRLNTLNLTDLFELVLIYNELEFIQDERHFCEAVAGRFHLSKTKILMKLLSPLVKEIQNVTDKDEKYKLINDLNNALSF